VTINPQSRLRYPLLGLSLLLLLAAIWAGLVRLGWRIPGLLPALPLSHGPLMVSGFLGTLIGLERAIAIRARWAYLGPLATALGALLLLLGVGGSIGALLITLGSLVLLLVFIFILRQHLALYTVTMTLGALVWLGGNLFWLSGWPIYRVVLWWAGFLILTIAGERLELARLLSLSRAKTAAFIGSIAVFLVALLVSMVSFDIGTRLAGLGMVFLAIWLLSNDIARHTIKKTALPRYSAFCLLSGYIWLALAGLISLGFGGMVSGMRYDAFLHAIFLGFVFSMLFAHAPIIFPSVLGGPVLYSSFFYVYLVLLQVSLLGRLAADLVGFWQFRLWSGLLNGVALILFVGSMLVLVAKSRLADRA
jgi:hypothetical protein